MLRPKSTQKRKIGIQASIVGVCWKPKKLVPVALLEDQHQQAVGRADREQVHHDRLDRHDERAEGQHQQQEAQPEHEGEDDRRVVVDHCVEVGVEGGSAGDEDLGRDVREGRRESARRAAMSTAASAVR